MYFKEGGYMEICFKTVDACNLNCAYCFYFRSRCRNYQNRNQYIISRPTIVKVTQFIKNGCLELGIKELGIFFAGSEPLLQDQSDFDFMCQHLSNN